MLYIVKGFICFTNLLAGEFKEYDTNVLGKVGKM